MTTGRAEIRGRRAPVSGDDHPPALTGVFTKFGNGENLAVMKKCRTLRKWRAVIRCSAFRNMRQAGKPDDPSIASVAGQRHPEQVDLCGALKVAHDVERTNPIHVARRNTRAQPRDIPRLLRNRPRAPACVSSVAARFTSRNQAPRSQAIRSTSPAPAERGRKLRATTVNPACADRCDQILAAAPRRDRIDAASPCTMARRSQA